MATPQLAATLFAWALAVDVDRRDAFHQRFLVSLLLSMGRFPWFWHDDLDKDELYQYLKGILEDSSCKSDGKIDFDSLHQRRIGLFRKGVSLANADYSLSQHDIGSLREKLSNNEAEKGTVLWQGKRGLCISLENTATPGNSVNVLCLQDPEGEAKFRKNL